MEKSVFSNLAKIVSTHRTKDIHKCSMRAMESADSALTTTMQNSADDRLKRLEWTDLLCQRLHDYQAKSTSLRKNGRKKRKKKKEKK